MNENDDALDELVALYRQSANETAPRRLDARVLRAAAAQDPARRVRRSLPWLGMAMAASFAIWLTIYHATPTRSARPLAEDAIGIYLLHMDVTPPMARHDAYANRNDGLHAAPADSDLLQETP